MPLKNTYIGRRKGDSLKFLMLALMSALLMVFSINMVCEFGIDYEESELLELAEDGKNKDTEKQKKEFEGEDAKIMMVTVQYLSPLLCDIQFKPGFERIVQHVYLNVESPPPDDKL